MVGISLTPCGCSPCSAAASWWGTHLSTLSVHAAGPKPSELYGKFTWKIENFSEISKRELRSTVFEVGSYKWCAPDHVQHFTCSGEALAAYSVRNATQTDGCVRHLNCMCWLRRYILVYPQGCDVCNHLSLFLCVADYDKLLPGVRLGCAGALNYVNTGMHGFKWSACAGWSHFAQFTIAVVNKDPKKSKYSGVRPCAYACVFRPRPAPPAYGLQSAARGVHALPLCMHACLL